MFSCSSWWQIKQSVVTLPRVVKQKIKPVDGEYLCMLIQSLFKKNICFQINVEWVTVFFQQRTLCVCMWRCAFAWIFMHACESYHPTWLLLSILFYCVWFCSATNKQTNKRVLLFRQQLWVWSADSFHCDSDKENNSIGLFKCTAAVANFSVTWFVWGGRGVVWLNRSLFICSLNQHLSESAFVLGYSLGMCVVYG